MGELERANATTTCEDTLINMNLADDIDDYENQAQSRPVSMQDENQVNEALSCYLQEYPQPNWVTRSTSNDRIYSPGCVTNEFTNAMQELFDLLGQIEQSTANKVCKPKKTVETNHVQNGSANATLQTIHETLTIHSSYEIKQRDVHITRCVSQEDPSTLGIQAYVKLNRMRIKVECE